ncbi:MAG: hypothetical protein IKV57_05415, partial [Clostridia bacterium]|nr:hypothetical protein [Clostridia bacterium]
RHHFHHGYVIGIAGSRSIVIQELSEKGFLYCEMHNDILHFTKDDYHLRVSFTPSGLTVLGIEMTRGDTESILENAVRDGYMKSISHTLLHPVRTYHYVISAIKKTDDNKS